MGGVPLLAHKRGCNCVLRKYWVVILLSLAFFPVFQHQKHRQQLNYLGGRKVGRPCLVAVVSSQWLKQEENLVQECKGRKRETRASVDFSSAESASKISWFSRLHSSSHLVLCSWKRDVCWFSSSFLQFLPSSEWLASRRLFVSTLYPAVQVFNEIVKNKKSGFT